MTDDYPTLYQLFGAYLNQDYYYIAESLGGVLANFIEENSDDTLAVLRSEASRFLRDNPSNLDSEFARRYGFDFNPKSWGHTTESFLEWLIANAHV